MNKTVLLAFMADCAVDFTGTAIVVERVKLGMSVFIR